jgi:hypothetical protein
LTVEDYIYNPSSPESFHGQKYPANAVHCVISPLLVH